MSTVRTPISQEVVFDEDGRFDHRIEDGQAWTIDRVTGDVDDVETWEFLQCSHPFQVDEAGRTISKAFRKFDAGPRVLVGPEPVPMMLPAHTTWGLTGKPGATITLHGTSLRAIPME